MMQSHGILLLPLLAVGIDSPAKVWCRAKIATREQTPQVGGRALLHCYHSVNSELNRS
jgi:hypothetical protein